MSKELLRDLEEKTKEINQIKEDLMSKLRPKLQGIFKDFLEKYPQIKYIQWQQYTPYFNDGEECVFHVYDLHAFTEHEDECDYEGSFPIYDFYFERSSDHHNTELDALINVFDCDDETLKTINSEFESISEAFEKIPEDIMRDLFGDHSQVTVTTKGISTEEYDHE